MTNEQKQAIQCVYLDMIGAKQAADSLDIFAHDWEAHQYSIDEIEAAFPDILKDLITEEQ